ncbi:MAG: IS1 family transposase [Ignavibacteria bacterium]|nr:IS1 family transposase [Ignavibacteria bacterium]
MNRLPTYKQILILSSLVEGNSIRSITRMLNVDKETVLKLLVNAGKKASEILDTELINIQSNFIQVDEIWTFVGKKQKQLTTDERYYEKTEFGDQYVFVAIDAETKLVVNYLVGKRTAENTLSFMQDLNARVNTEFQLSSDSFNPYKHAVRRTFGNEIAYAQIHKQYGEEIRDEKRYSPARITGIKILPISGDPKMEHISTSYIERQNLTMRMNMRRFTRLTNAFSKKLDNLKYAVALHFFHYNFMRVHQTLRATPAMVAGISSTFWSWERFLGVEEQRKMVA